MGTGDDLRNRMWRERLATAFRTHLGMEHDEAEALADLVLFHGLPPGQSEEAVRSALSRSRGASPEWVEQVLAIVRSVRDVIRLPTPEPEPPLQIAEPPTPQVPPAKTTGREEPEHELIMVQFLERLRAVKQCQQVEPQVLGAQKSMRALRIAVSGEADDSVQLPLLLDEWRATRHAWDQQYRVLQTAKATLRATDWLLALLRWPTTTEE